MGRRGQGARRDEADADRFATVRLRQGVVEGSPIRQAANRTRASAAQRAGDRLPLEWDDPEKNDKITGDTFPDGAALLFPMDGDAPILTMGDKQHAVNAWHWRADLGDVGRNNVARGLGSTVLSEKSHIVCRAVWQSGVWRVVFARPLSVPDQKAEAVQLKPGQDLRFGVAVWQGQNAERAGIKAFSQAWRTVTIEA